MAFDLSAFYFNLFLTKQIDTALIEDFLSQTIERLLFLNATVFSQIMVRMRNHDPDTMANGLLQQMLQTQHLWENRDPNSQFHAIGTHLGSPLRNKTLHFALNLYQYSVQEIFFAKWNDIMRILRETEFGKSDMIHPILKNGWDNLWENANIMMYQILPNIIKEIKNNYMYTPVLQKLSTDSAQHSINFVHF